MKKSNKDYLAIAFTATGGSYFRADSKDKAVATCATMFRKDWAGLFDMRKLLTLNVYVYDITGHDEVHWNNRGDMYDSKTNVQINVVPELVEYSFKRKSYIAKAMSA